MFSLVFFANPGIKSVCLRGREREESGFPVAGVEFSGEKKWIAKRSLTVYRLRGKWKSE